MSNIEYILEERFKKKKKDQNKLRKKVLKKKEMLGRGSKYQNSSLKTLMNILHP